MNHKLDNRFTVLATLLVGMFPSLAHGQKSSFDNDLHSPVRLKADGQVIDNGPRFGHSGPCVEDIDGDGLDDLLVGDFLGKFRVFRNIGDATKPSYEGKGVLQADGKDAALENYCCVATQPRLYDLDGDGIRDMISSSYEPGHCYVFRGLPDHQFAAPEELVDKTGVPVRSSPIQELGHESLGSFFEMVDWDDDGDLDILIGCFNGFLKLRINEGSKTKAQYATENIDVEVKNEPLRVKAHFCPKVADWDGDGLWDIVAGSEDGSVTVFRNIGTKKEPEFASGFRIVKPHDGDGESLVIWNESEIVPGIRSQVEVTDFNGDGKLDLLVGDHYSAYAFKADLSEQQKKEAEELIARFEASSAGYHKLFQAFKEKHADSFGQPDKLTKEVMEAMEADGEILQQSPEAKRKEEAATEFAKALRPYVETSRGRGHRVYDLTDSHGHIWLYLRK